MRLSCSFALTLTLAALCPMRAQSPQPSPAFLATAPANDVTFTISLDRTRYGKQEDVPVHYRITNVGNGPLYVPRDFATTACLDIGPPHIWDQLEDAHGRHTESGYAVSCGGTPGVTYTLIERMLKGSILLHSGQHVDGVFTLQPAMFALPPGSYRVEMVLRGWGTLTNADLTELSTLGTPFLIGEVPATTEITLISAP